MPGLLKTLRENRHVGVPVKIFEVGDVVLKDSSLERKSRNERRFAAAWCGKSSGFEVVHGLLDRIMLMLRAAYAEGVEGLETEVGSKKGQAKYWISEVDGKLFT